MRKDSFCTYFDFASQEMDLEKSWLMASEASRFVLLVSNLAPFYQTSSVQVLNVLGLLTSRVTE